MAAKYLSEESSPLLNVGSSTREYNEKYQPWIERDLFAPLRKLGVKIINLDRHVADGVDITADIMNDDDFARIKASPYRTILCCNIMEHVVDPAELARRCTECVEPGGTIIVTVPNSYPRHSDPFDNLFRPTPEQVAALFPDCDVLDGAIIDSGMSYRDHVYKRPWILLRHVVRFPFPFVNFEKWKHSMKKLQWLVHNFRVTGIVLRRRPTA
jgi:SAM-dependent methyltransferase